MYKYIDLSNIPKLMNGNSNKYNWKDSVGKIIPFTYSDIAGYLTIIEYNDKSNLTVMYNNKTHTFSIGDIKKCNIGRFIGEYGKHKYFVGEIVNGNMLILECVKIKSENGYKYKCINCNKIDTIYQKHLVEGRKCKCRIKNYAVGGENDIATVRPDLIKYFYNTSDAFKYNKSSDIIVKFKCIDCNHVKNYKVRDVVFNGFKCDYCSDNISYPEKFLNNLLMQLKLKYICQFSKHDEKWITSNFRYDFYIINKACIIETHGIQHYERSFEYIGGRTLEQEQENDKLKKQLAKESGIKHYIVLDCRKSEFEWIKKSVMKSELPTLFNFTEEDIDWLKCEEYALSNLIKKVSLCYENHTKSIKQISEIFHLSTSTIANYLKIGSEIKLCNYKTYNEFSTNNVVCATLQKIKPIKCVETGDEFYGIKECVEKSFEKFKVQFSKSGLHRAVNKTYDFYKGYSFIHISKDEFIKNHPECIDEIIKNIKAGDEI